MMCLELEQTGAEGRCPLTGTDMEELTLGRVVCRHYLEYKKLKKQLKRVIVATHEHSAAVAKSEREGFERALDSEVSAHQQISLEVVMRTGLISFA